MNRWLWNVLFLLALNINGQQKFELFVDGDFHTSWLEKDSVDNQRRIDRFLKEWWMEGYLFAGVDSMNIHQAYMHRGGVYEITDGQKRKTLERLKKEAQSELLALANDGYPFAKIHWISPEWDTDRLKVDYEVIEGPFILYDSLIINSRLKTKTHFLERSVGLRQGSPYSEEVFNSLTRRLGRIPFIEVGSPPDVSFLSNKAWVHLDIKEQQTGRFSGILGVLPNQSGNSRPLITGNLDLELLNLFRSGKELDFSWQRFNEQSQRLEARYSHPYILGSGVGIEGRVALLRQDTTFIRSSLGLALNGYISDATRLGVRYEWEEASSIDPSSDFSVGDYAQNWYGVFVSKEAGTRQAFRNFYSFEAQVSVGQRRIFDAQIVGGVRENTNWRTEGRLSNQWIMGKPLAVYSETSMGHISNRRPLQNQSFRVGGLQTLRGFNEQFFFAQSYVIQQTEFRLFFEERSYVFAFWDQGFVLQDDWTRPTGLGLGLTVETSSGLFSFAMALGQSEEIPLNLSNVKVHFGYISTF